MSIRVLFVFFITILASCTSDEIITKEKNEYVGIFRNVIRNSFLDKNNLIKPEIPKKTSQWLSRFKHL